MTAYLKKLIYKQNTKPTYTPLNAFQKKFFLAINKSDLPDLKQLFELEDINPNI